MAYAVSVILATSPVPRHFFVTSDIGKPRVYKGMGRTVSRGMERKVGTGDGGSRVSVDLAPLTGGQESRLGWRIGPGADLAISCLTGWITAGVR